MIACTRTYKGTTTVTYNGDELGTATRVVAVYVGPNTYSAGDTTNVKYILEAVTVEEAYREKQESDAADEPAIVERHNPYGRERDHRQSTRIIDSARAAARKRGARHGALPAECPLVRRAFMYPAAGRKCRLPVFLAHERADDARQRINR